MSFSPTTPAITCGANDHMQKNSLGIHFTGPSHSHPLLDSISIDQLVHTTHNINNLDSSNMEPLSPTDSVLDLDTEYNMNMTTLAAQSSCSPPDQRTRANRGTTALIVSLCN